jgi:hypothetical protein
MSKKNNATSPFLDAAIAYYEAQRAEALATLDIYFRNPVAIADHSNFLNDIKKWTEVLSSSEENLKSLKKHFKKELM